MYFFKSTASPEWGTPIADCVYMNVYRKNVFAYAENDDCTGIRYPTDVMLSGFRSHLEKFRVSTHTEEFWYNEIDSLWMTIHTHTYIFIYIYITVHIAAQPRYCHGYITSFGACHYLNLMTYVWGIGYAYLFIPRRYVVLCQHLFLLATVFFNYLYIRCQYHLLIVRHRCGELNSTYFPFKSSCAATNPPSWKSFKKSEQIVPDTAKDVLVSDL